MSLESKEGFKKTQKQLPPQGLQLAMCYSIIDLGTQLESYAEASAKPTPKVQFSWEFPSLPLVTFDKDKGPQPMAVFQAYTVAAGDQAKLPKMLASWGQIKIEKISTKLLQAFLGAPCMINIEHVVSKKDVDGDTGKLITYANIGLKGASVLPKIAEIAKPAGTINPKVFFTLDDFSWPAFNALPKGVQKIIEKCTEWPAILQKNPRPADTAVANAQNQGTVNNANSMASVENTAPPVTQGNGTGLPAF